MAIHLKFSYSNMLIMENIGNFPEKYDENFRKFSGKNMKFFRTVFRLTSLQASRTVATTTKFKQFVK